MDRRRVPHHLGYNADNSDNRNSTGWRDRRRDDYTVTYTGGS
jgi:hypothetical protein